jgi:hypothetical protein
MGVIYFIAFIICLAVGVTGPAAIESVNALDASIDVSQQDPLCKQSLASLLLRLVTV